MLLLCLPHILSSSKQHPNVHNEIMMERRTLCERISATKQTNHPFIVQMQAAFDDYEHIYFLQDLHIECGDLWSRLKHEKKMVGCHRSQAKQWIYQLVDAIEHLHRHGVRRLVLPHVKKLRGRRTTSSPIQLLRYGCSHLLLYFIVACRSCIATLNQVCAACV